MTDPRLPAAYLQPGVSSFADFLADQAPDLLPARRSVPQGNAGDLAPHGTTIVAATFPGGVVMAGDRRATMGHGKGCRGSGPPASAPSTDDQDHARCRTSPRADA